MIDNLFLFMGRINYLNWGMVDFLFVYGVLLKIYL